jgi:hypothetical protein
MPQYKHILTDFKDLRKVIGEVTKSQPAKTRYQQQAEKMGYKQTLESALSDMQSIVKDKQAKKINGVMVDLFTASFITKTYDKVNDANKKKIEKANLQTLVKLAHRLMGMKEELGLNESKMGDLLIDIQSGATAKELVKYHNISLQTAKNFLSDYYASKRTRTAPGLKKESKSVNEMKLNQIKSKFRSQIAKFQKGGDLDYKAEKELLGWAYEKGEISGDDAEDADDWLVSFVADKKAFARLKEENLQEKPSILQKDIKGSKTITDIEIRFSDEKEWKRMSALVKRELSKPPYNKLPKPYFVDDPLQMGFGDPKGKSGIDIKSIVDLVVRNTNDPQTRIKSMSEGKSREDRLKEQKEHAQQSPFKLKSQQYPRAIAINTDGFGHRHATVEDIITACDSFGMIIDKELQVEQIQKQLGKKGFISYKQSELEDVFESRETQRMILALESVVEDQEPIEYTKGEIEYAELHEQEIEFLKPDGTKSVGPILKMSGKTYNVKDKFTGKSFTYKYSNKLEENKVDYEKSWTSPGQGLKSYAELTEGKFPPSLIKKAIKIANLPKYKGGNYSGAAKEIEKLKKGLADDPKVLDALRVANEDIDEWISKDGTRRRVKERDQRKYKKVQEWEEAAEASGDKAAYQKFFKAALKKFGVSSPDELKGDKEKEFYNYVDKNWKADHEESVDVHTNYKVDGRRKNFREKMRKLGYVKKQF